MIRQRIRTALLTLTVIVGVWRGYVALFDPGKEEPRQIFPCPVSSLPETDQEALEKRIPIRNASALQQALEDYLS